MKGRGGEVERGGRRERERRGTLVWRSIRTSVSMAAVITWGTSKLHHACKKYLSYRIFSLNLSLSLTRSVALYLSRITICLLYCMLHESHLTPVPLPLSLSLSISLCRCRPSYSGERCHLFTLASEGRDVGGYSRTTALAVVAVVLSSLCLTIIGLLLVLRSVLQPSHTHTHFILPPVQLYDTMHSAAAGDWYSQYWHCIVEMGQQEMNSTQPNWM